MCIKALMGNQHSEKCKMLFTLSACSDVSLVYDCLQIVLGLRRPGCDNFSIANPRRFPVSQNCVKRNISVYYSHFCQSEIQYLWSCKYSGFSDLSVT
jgi:hypothetical protein